MKWVFIIIALASAVLYAGATGSDVLTNRRTNDDGHVHTADEIYSKAEDSFIHRVLQQDSQRQRNQNQNQNRNPNRDRNRQPNRQQNGGRNRDRNRNSGGVCTPFGSQCEPTQSNCCQGGCNLSTNQCFCQDNGGLCFNKGGEDNFCCSNRCGDDGVCSCIAMGESCAVGGAFCCGGLTCNDGQCVQGTNTAVATEQPTPLPIPRPSLEPTVLPTPRPTLMPTPEPTEQPTHLPTPRPSPKPTTEQPTPLPTPHPSPRPTTFRPTTRPSTKPTLLPTLRPSPRPTSHPSPRPTPKPTLEPTRQCRGYGGACYGFNHMCCSGVCGEDETCKNRCHRIGDSCFGVHESCCSGLCGENGVCVRMTKQPTSEPTAPPSSPPSKAPTNPPTRKPTRPPTPMPSNPPTLPPTRLPTPFPTQTPEPTRSPTLSPTINPTISASTHRQQLIEKGHSVFEPRSSNGCQSGLYKIKVEILTDKFGGDTAWSLIEDSSGDVIYSVKEKTYNKYSLDTVEICVNAGNHTFKISDDYGDGVCCQQGDGYIKVHLEEREILHITQQFKDLSLNINVGYDPTLKMKERDFLYLEAHNRRREIWHEGYDKTYEPLIWSNELAESSRRWAEESLVNCSLVGILHDGKNPYGENLAENKGERETWGQLYPPDLIVGRWVDREVGLPYPSNAHLTAALWRGSKYVGCGEAEKDWGREAMGNRGKCRVQVCRYARTCNCGMGAFKNGEDWLIPMLADTSKCGPDCPPEGCY